MGRKTKLTTQMIEDLCSNIEHGLPIQQACRRVGIVKQTYYNWKRKGQADPDSVYGEFFSRLETAEAECQHRALEAIWLGNKDWVAKAWLLERRWPELYGRGLDRQAAMQVDDVQRKKVDDAELEDQDDDTILELIEAENAAA
jgi:hypothetical protein